MKLTVKKGGIMAKKKMALVDVRKLSNLIRESRAYFALRDVDSWHDSEDEHDKWLDEVRGLEPHVMVKREGHPVLEIDEETYEKMYEEIDEEIDDESKNEEWL